MCFCRVKEKEFVMNDSKYNATSFAVSVEEGMGTVHVKDRNKIISDQRSHPKKIQRRKQKLIVLI